MGKLKSPPPAVSFVAKSGTGKTTLLETVLRELTRRGWRVGAVKHDAHSFEIDHEGKDSWRLTKAGASPMVISSPEKLAVVQDGLQGEIPLDEIIERFMGGADLVLTEGYKTGHLPKIEVHRQGRSEELLCVDGAGQVTDEDLVAVVSDADRSLPVPVLPLDDPASVCDFLEERFLGGRAPSH
jgi:molybdopterin-guanine dinucleotide biosynthesis protein MobB